MSPEFIAPKKVVPIEKERITKEVVDITPVDADALMKARLEFRVLNDTRNARDRELGAQREQEMADYQVLLDKKKAEIELLETKEK